MGTNVTWTRRDSANVTCHCWTSEKLTTLSVTSVRFSIARSRRLQQARSQQLGRLPRSERRGVDPVVDGPTQQTPLHVVVDHLALAGVRRVESSEHIQVSSSLRLADRVHRDWAD